MYVSVFSEEDSVLLVGEGNFSFTVDLVDLLRLNITATCLESDPLSEITQSNAEKLRERGVQVCVGVDGTKLSEHPVFGQKRFDKVVFNFPHVGGKMQLGRNRELLRQFLCSAAGMLREGGRVVVSLCRGQGGTPADQPRAWGDTWQAVEMAAHADLVLDDVHPFWKAAFPHYTCVGYRSRDSAFQLDGALVHVFRPAGPLLPLSPATLPTPACNYLLPFLHAFLRSRYHVRPVQLPPRVVGELLSHYCALIPPQGALDTQVGVAHTLVLPTSPPNLSAPPAAVQALLVGGHAGLGADFVRHILEMFHRQHTFSVLVETGLRTVEGKSDVLLASKDEVGSRRLMCEEDLRTVEGKSDVLLASKDEVGSRRLMCEEDLRTVEGKSDVLLASKDEVGSRRLMCEEDLRTVEGKSDVLLASKDEVGSRRLMCEEDLRTVEGKSDVLLASKDEVGSRRLMCEEDLRTVEGKSDVLLASKDEVGSRRLMCEEDLRTVEGKSDVLLASKDEVGSRRLMCEEDLRTVEGKSDVLLASKDEVGSRRLMCEEDLRTVEGKSDVLLASKDEVGSRRLMCEEDLRTVEGKSDVLLASKDKVGSRRLMCEEDLRTVEGKSDVLLASKDEVGSRRLMCEEDLRTVEGKSDVLLASKDEVGSRRLMCEEDLRTVEGKSDVLLASKDEVGSRRLMCEEDLRTVEGKSDVLLASKDEVGSRRLMCEEDLRTVEGKSNVLLASKDEDGSRSLVCEEYVLGGRLLVSVLHLDRLAGVVLGAADWRELWAEGARVEVKDGVPSLKLACLHSVPHVLDVTFRVPCVWLEEKFWAALWDLAGSVISGVSLLNTYQSPEGWTSHCYRITYHSFSKAMSRNKAIMVHHIICKGLVDKLGVAIF
ncbi:uncharacterized protein LOC134527302 [Bacillus rossius redtenbacheri]|uniref:uncharacterized protein LOC134527302 n=1 Tax=Bacillus rossius redtenbacheri TaxID=93214 RepID=UPI002FDE83A7